MSFGPASPGGSKPIFVSSLTQLSNTYQGMCWADFVFIGKLYLDLKLLFLGLQRLNQPVYLKNFVTVKLIINMEVGG
jgi:hypothetical protein